MAVSAYVLTLELILQTVPPHHRQENLHSAGALRAQNVCLILYNTVFGSHILEALRLLGVVSVIVEVELCTKEIRTQFTQITLRYFLHLFLIKSYHVIRGCVSRALLSI